MSKEKSVEYRLDTADPDGGEKKHSGKYVPTEKDAPSTGIYLMRTFVGQKGQTAKRVRITFQILE